MLKYSPTVNTFCVCWHDYVAVHGLKLNSSANMNHSKSTVIHMKWVFIPPIVLSVKARHIIPSYVRCSIIVLWMRKTPLSAIQQQVERFVVSYQSLNDQRDLTTWRSLITYLFLDLATPRAWDRGEFTEVVRTQNDNPDYHFWEPCYTKAVSSLRRELN